MGSLFSPVPSRLAAVIFCIVSAIPCAAQTKSEQDLMNLDLRELSQVQVYSASRRLENAHDAPSSVSIITAEDIRRYGWRTLSDIIRSLRGFYTSYDRNYSYLGVRGFMRPGDYNSRVLLLLNGSRINENVYESATIGTEFPLDLDLIDYIEVVRGPGSSLFGTNAIFGVINVVTRAPALAPSIEVSGDVSSFLSRTGRITASMTRGRLAGLLSGSLYESAGPANLYFPEFAGPGLGDGIARNLDGDRYSHLFSQLRYGDFKVQGIYSGRRKIIPTAAYGTNFNDPGTRTTDREMYVDVEYEHSLSNKTSIDLRALEHHYVYEGTYAYGGKDSPDRYLNYDSSGADWNGAELTLDHKFGSHHLIVGTSYEYNFRINQKTFYVGQPPLLDDHRNPWQTALFGETQLKLPHGVSLDLGGRFDYFQLYGAALSPRLAFVYAPSSRTAWKYIFGRAFRAPNAFENYYVDGVSTEAPPVPLQMEHIRSHEVVFEHQLAPWLSLTADGYYNNLDQLIDWVLNPSTELSHTVNVGRVRGRGLEFEIGAKSVSGLEANASYTFADAFDLINRQTLNNSPRHLAKFHGLLPIRRHAFLGVEAIYSSSQESYMSTPVPPWFLTNLTVSTRPLWGGWEFSASCYNLLDRRWFGPMGFGDSEPAIQQDGRTVRFKLSYRLAREKRK